jgi:anti-sigma factor RsiW
VSIGVAHLSCRELVELVTAYLEGALSLEDRMRFENHLSACDGCTTYLTQMRRTIELTGTLRVDDVPPESVSKLMHAFRNWQSE